MPFLLHRKLIPERKRLLGMYKEARGALSKGEVGDCTRPHLKIRSHPKKI